MTLSTCVAAPPDFNVEASMSHCAKQHLLCLPARFAPCLIPPIFWVSLLVGLVPLPHTCKHHYICFLVYIPKWRTSSILFRINGTLHLLDKSVWWILMKHGCSPHAVEQTAGCNSKKPLSKNGITIQLSSLQSQELDAPAPDAAEDHEDILLVVLTSGDQQRVICWTVWEVVQNVLRHPEQDYRTICMCNRCLSSNSGPGLQKKEDQARWPSNFQERLLGTQQ